MVFQGEDIPHVKLVKEGGTFLDEQTDPFGRQVPYFELIGQNGSTNGYIHAVKIVDH
jgi:hypothetical protein